MERGKKGFWGRDTSKKGTFFGANRGGKRPVVVLQAEENEKKKAGCTSDISVTGPQPGGGKESEGVGGGRVPPIGRVSRIRLKVKKAKGENWGGGYNAKKEDREVLHDPANRGAGNNSVGQGVLGRPEEERPSNVKKVVT